MSDWDAGESYGFHPPICICQGVQLHLHLAGLRPMKHAFVEEFLYVLLYKEGQLEGKAYASIVQSCEFLGQQLAVLRYRRSAARTNVYGSTWYDFRTPLCTQVIFRGVENRNQYADDAISVGLVAETLIHLGGDGTAGQKAACEVANGRYDDGEIVAAIPKPII